MSLTTRVLSNVGNPLYSVNGNILANESITFTLVDNNGIPVSAFTSAGSMVMGKTTVLTNNSGEFTVNLWANDQGDIETKYICSIESLNSLKFSASVPSGNSTLSWLNFKLSGAILTPQEVTALNVHIGDIYAHSAIGGVVGISAVQPLLNKRITRRVLNLTNNSATPIINTNLYDVVRISNQVVAISSFTTNLTGTPVDGDELKISITGTQSISISFGSSFESSTLSLPTTTSGTSRLDLAFVWNVATSKWRLTSAA